MTQIQKPQQPEHPQSPQLPPQYSFLWLSTAIFLMFFWLQQGSQQPAITELPYSQFKEAVASEHVEEATLRADHIEGKLTGEGGRAWVENSDSLRFHSVRPPIEDPDLLPLLETHGVTVSALSGVVHPSHIRAITFISPWFLTPTSRAALQWRRNRNGKAVAVQPIVKAYAASSRGVAGRVLQPEPGNRLAFLYKR